jgi:hypothetical protein
VGGKTPDFGDAATMPNIRWRINLGIPNRRVSEVPQDIQYRLLHS